MQLPPRLLHGETPLDRGVGRIATFLIGGEFAFQGIFIWNATRQALPTHHAQFNLGHIEPTGVLGRIVQRQFFQDPSGLRRDEGFIQRRGAMGVEIIQDYPNHLRVGITVVDQPPHLVREVMHGALHSHLDMPPAGLRLAHEKQITGSIALILIVIASRLSGPGRHWDARLGNQLPACLVKGDRGPTGIIGLGVQLQDVLHGGHELGAHRWQTPLLVLPRLEDIFFRIWRTVSRAIESAKPNSTTLSASRRSVQWRCPAGAGVHATAMRWASCLPVSLRSPPGRGRSSRAARLASTKRCRVRPTVAMPTSSAAAISASVRPSSAFSKMRARVSWRVPEWPRRKSCSTSPRSSGVKSITYRFFGMAGPSRWCGKGQIVADHCIFTKTA